MEGCAKTLRAVNAVLLSKCEVKKKQLSLGFFSFFL